MKRLYALLVGINDYRSPITPLKGCIKDIDRLHQFLSAHFKSEFELNIKRLENAQATYGNIIAGFRNHLRQAGGEDVVWFHFSGHGCETPTADPFLSIEPSGKDQTLVCYDSHKGQGGFHLADKELAVLLHEVAHQKPDGSPKITPHIMVSLDCCHSGSGTRDLSEDVFFTPRSTTPSDQKRSIDTYIDGYYTQQKGAIQIPVSEHVLLSACESVQRAGDLPQGGAFTSGLIDALNMSKGKINYADLFIRTRSSVKKIRKNQTPQFETIGNFNPYTRFLEGSAFGRPDIYEIQKDEGNWYVKCGAIHGLPTNPDNPIELIIQNPAPDNKKIGEATILAVGAQRSKIEFKSNFGFKHLLDKILPGSDHYRAIIKHLPNPEMVYIHGEPEGLNLLKSQWEGTIKTKYTTDETDVDWSMEVFADSNFYEIVDGERACTVFKTKDISKDSAGYTIDALERIVTWRRTRNLENKDSNAQLGVMAKCKLEVILYETNRNITPLLNKEVKLYASKDNSQKGKFGFQPKVTFSCIDQNLYFYLFHLQSNYRIGCYEGEIVYRPDEHEGKSEVTLPLWKNILSWGLHPDENEATSYFKLITTTEPLDYQTLEQSGLGGERDALDVWNPYKIADDWTTNAIKVTVLRDNTQIKPDREVLLSEGKVRILPHTNIQAKVSMSSAHGSDRSIDPSHRFAQISNNAFQLCDFNSSRDVIPANVVELNDLRIDDPSILQSNPLDIIIAEQPAENEMMVPISFDGEHFRIIGDSEPSGKEILVHIRELPEPSNGSESIKDPFSEEMLDRSLTKALKLAFFKVVFKKKDGLQKLLWVERPENGKIIVHHKDLKEKIEKANNILLVIPGILGDGVKLAENIYASDSLEGEAIANRFDLVMVYDYENLNTPIEDSANKLKELLLENGIGQDKKGQITIIAHSIGGLLARWFIEKEDGKTCVSQLILLGTPNAGSGIGKIDKYRKFASTTLDLAINFVPDLIPFSGYLLKTLKFTGEVTRTLGQIDPDSDFLKKLNQSADPKIPYVLIGGTAKTYDLARGGFKEYLRKWQKKIGDWATQNEDHDLLVGLASSQNEEIWKGRQPLPIKSTPVACHHLNYLYTESGQKEVKRFLFAPDE